MLISVKSAAEHDHWNHFQVLERLERTVSRLVIDVFVFLPKNLGLRLVLLKLALRIFLPLALLKLALSDDPPVKSAVPSW